MPVIGNIEHPAVGGIPPVGFECGVVDSPGVGGIPPGGFKFGVVNSPGALGETNTGPGYAGGIEHPFGNMGTGPFAGDMNSPGVLCGVIDHPAVGEIEHPCAGDISHPFGQMGSPVKLFGIIEHPAFGVIIHPFGDSNTPPCVGDSSTPPFVGGTSDPPFGQMGSPVLSFGIIEHP